MLLGDGKVKGFAFFQCLGNLRGETCIGDRSSEKRRSKNN